MGWGYVHECRENTGSPIILWNGLFVRGQVSQMELDGFPGIFSGLLDRTAVGNATRKERYEDGIATLLFSYQNDLE
jgi:hypothetical protein